MSKFVYSFSEGSKQMSKLLGNKGANLADMTKLGLPVPFGFTITTDACKEYNKENKISEELAEEIRNKMKELEEVTSKKFGDSVNPLLLSVRSSSIVTVPGIIEVILNVGLNDESVVGLANITGNERFAYDRYRKFIQEYSEKILGIGRQGFGEIYDQYQNKAKEENRETTTDEIKETIIKYKELVKSKIDIDFPQEIRQQIIFVIKAVYDSWNGEIASRYRERNSIKDSIGIAINLQAMVFGNTGKGSCTGVAYTRNPVTGGHHIFGDFKVNSHGESNGSRVASQPIQIMKDFYPREYANLEKISGILEGYYKDIQEMEFIVENHKLYMLQTKKAKRTTDATIRIAVDLVNEEVINREEALMRLEPSQIEQFMDQYFDQEKLWEGKLEVKDEIRSLKPQGIFDEEIDFISYFRTIMRWSDDIKKIEVRCSADNQMEALQASALGTEGIGLCRTGSSIKENLKSIYEVMGERRVAITILDQGAQAEDTFFNGRGVGIEYPNQIEVQIKAIIMAAIEVNQENAMSIVPEVIVPFVTIKEELIIIREMINKAAKEVIKEVGVEQKFTVGTMIDTPRTALIADKLAKYSDFLVFDTNNLTNMTFGLMDHQIETVIKQYEEKEISSKNPLKDLDVNGVGRLIKAAVSLSRKEKKNIKLGICGRHTGSKDTVQFCVDLGIDFISCSPSKIPSVKLAAAQSEIKKRHEGKNE